MKTVTMMAALAPLAAMAAAFPLDEAVIVRNDSSRITKEAANELAHHLELIGGAKIKEDVAPGKGLTFYFSKPVDARKPGANEACYRIAGNRVWFWGEETRHGREVYPAARFAVYTFLRNELGVTWVSPGDVGIVVHESKSIELPESKESVYTPPFRQEIFRQTNLRGMTVPDMPIIPDFLKVDPVPKALLLSHDEACTRIQDTGRWYDRMLLYSPDPISYGHAFTKWQPRFYDTHPEYLALNEKGERGEKGYDAWIKLCVSNPAVHDQIIADWQAAGCPRYLNVCENDGAGFCRCEKCCALDCPKEGEGFEAHKSDRYLWFANRIAEKAIKIRPDVQVSTYIYAFYRHIPRRERIEYPDNMVFGAVPSLADDYHKFFTDWKSVGMKHFFLRPNFHTSWETLPIGCEKRIYDIFQDGIASGLVGFDCDAYNWRFVLGPHSYVTARLMSDPKVAFETIMTEYYSAYGAASGEARQYFERIRARYDEQFARSANAAKKANVLDDSHLAFAQTLRHSDAVLKEDLAILEAAKERHFGEMTRAERIRLEVLIVRARMYIKAFRLFKSAEHPENKDEIAAATRDLINYRLENRAVLMDNFTQVMNTRCGGTEGWVYKFVPEVMKELGGMTPRPDGKEYSW